MEPPPSADRWAVPQVVSVPGKQRLRQPVLCPSRSAGSKAIRSSRTGQTESIWLTAMAAPVKDSPAITPSVPAPNPSSASPVGARAPENVTGPAMRTAASYPTSCTPLLTVTVTFPAGR